MSTGKLSEKNKGNAVFRHVTTGITGFFVKEYKPTGKPATMQIKLLDNRIKTNYCHSNQPFKY